MRGAAECSLRSPVQAPGRAGPLPAPGRAPAQRSAPLLPARRTAGLATRPAAVPFLSSVAATVASWPAAAVNAAVVLGVAALALAIKRVFDTPSRTYNANVGQEYDRWTEEGILEYYWGEHIHLGYYTEEEQKRGYLKKDFIQAKYDFVDEMLKFSGTKQPKRILDVGCGIGGTTRHLAAKFPDAEVIGITLSPQQVQRANQLAKDRGLKNVSFMVMDALKMGFEDESFDLVWACESGEHMPDKKKYVEEMSRVLAPGGDMVIACWCQREEGDRPFTAEDKSALQFLYDEWAHPFFISKEKFGELVSGAGVYDGVRTENWTRQTLPSWRHSVSVGIFDPWIVLWKGLTRGPWVWYMVMREIVTLERMHRAFARGLMEYGMIRGTKLESTTATALAGVPRPVGRGAGSFR